MRKFGSLQVIINLSSHVIDGPASNCHLSTQHRHYQLGSQQLRGEVQAWSLHKVTHLSFEGNFVFHFIRIFQGWQLPLLGCAAYRGASI